MERDLAKHRRIDEITTGYLKRQLPVNIQRQIKQHVTRYYWMAASQAASESKQPSKQILWCTENLFALMQGRQKSACCFWRSEERSLSPFPGKQRGLFDSQSHCNWWANKSKLKMHWNYAGNKETMPALGSICTGQLGWCTASVNLGAPCVFLSTISSPRKHHMNASYRRSVRILKAVICLQQHYLTVFGNFSTGC